MKCDSFRYLVILDFQGNMAPRSFYADTLNRVYQSAILSLTFHNEKLASIHLLCFEGDHLYDNLISSVHFSNFQSFSIFVNSVSYEQEENKS